MKGIDLLCASPASTAVCVNTDHHAMVRHGGRKLDRHNPHLRDGRRTKPTTLVPSSSSQLPPTKQPKHRHHQKSKKSSSSSSSSSSAAAAANNKPTYELLSNIASPPGSSSRYLLSDSASAFYDVLSEFEPVSAFVAAEHTMPSRSKIVDEDEFDDFPPTFVTSTSSSVSLHPSSSASTSTTVADSAEQVVVLRVSLHCKGCEGKVRKHISRMKGVTSFNIDFAMKKVTVVGDVTPLGVLASVSRVKRAQFWPPASTSSAF